MSEAGREAARQAAERAEVEAWLDAELTREPSPERKQEMTEEISRAADFFLNAEIEFFIAGGSGLDLLDAEWQRDHQDLDVAIRDADRLRFFDHAIADGFTVTNPETGRAVTRDEMTEARMHNVFIKRDEESLEVMFMLLDEQGLELSKRGHRAPAEAFTNPPTTKLDDREIQLIPTEIILFYKLNDGRRKDLLDIRRYLGALSETERAQLDTIISEVGFTFTVGDQTVSTIDELLPRAEQYERQLRTRALERHQETTEELKRILRQLFDLSQIQPTKKAFIKTVTSQFPEPHQRPLIDLAARRLYESDLSTEVQFVESMTAEPEVQAMLKQRTLTNFKEEQIWETRLG